MKKIIQIFAFIMIAAITVMCFSGCENEAKDNKGLTKKDILNSYEYALYCSVLDSQQSDSYIGKEHTVQGVFSTIIDRYNEATRYYVWGYSDETHCCSYQWELAPSSLSALPENGSIVTVSGKFASDSAALDGMWISDASITIDNPAEKSEYSIDMTTMSGTLERVQILNMQRFSDFFEGNSVRAYGRVAGENTFIDPYYDGSWTQTYENDEVLPTGSQIIVTGVWRSGTIADAAAANNPDA